MERSSPFLQKYERARLIATRVAHLMNGSGKKTTDTFHKYTKVNALQERMKEIAIDEINTGSCPLTIIREDKDKAYEFQIEGINDMGIVNVKLIRSFNKTEEHIDRLR